MIKRISITSIFVIFVSFSAFANSINLNVIDQKFSLNSDKVKSITYSPEGAMYLDYDGTEYLIFPVLDLEIQDIKKFTNQDNLVNAFDVLLSSKTKETKNIKVLRMALSIKPDLSNIEMINKSDKSISFIIHYERNRAYICNAKTCDMITSLGKIKNLLDANSKNIK